MSELFDEDPRDTPPPRSGSRRSRALIITAVVLVLAFLGLSTFANIYTDRLWYKYGGYSNVFSTLFWTKTGLFLVFGALMAVVVGVNVYLAYRFRPFFRPNSPEQNGLDRYRDAITPIRTWLLVGISVAMGAFAGSSAIGEWRDYLLWRNGGDFGTDDAYFHKDIGFYVFDLPWLHYLVDFAMAALVIALIAAAIVHYLYGGIRLQATRDRLSGAAQAQLSVLLGLFVLAKAGDYWLDRFDLVHQSGPLITGMTYTDDHAVLPAKNILLGISIICAVLFFVNVWRRTWLLPSVGLALLAVSAILLGLIWPGIVQQFQVKPSEADKEAPYIQANIDATRAAYDLGDVTTEDYSDDTSSNDAWASVLSQTKSVPLVDPQLVNKTFQQQQQGLAYYSVAPVLDVDRYDVDGTDRAVVLGVRELDQDNISSNSKNWSNLHTVYTHGNGIIAAYGNQRPADDGAEVNSGGNDEATAWAEGLNAKQRSLRSATGDYETQVYYGEDSPDYSIVGKASTDAADVELDLDLDASTAAEKPSDDQSSDDSSSTAGTGATTRTTYEGKGGVPVGSFFNKLMYAVKFGEPNFLLSERVNANSKVLYNRNPRDAVEKVAPWLTIDGDAYPAIVDHKIVWILDGYTTTDRYPSSQRESFATMTDDSLQDTSGLRTLPTDEVNYVRNAVKATVDAYDGTVTLYEWDDQDPILKAWEGAFPGTVTPKSEIPTDLLSHFRYPEDMFKAQRYQYARYHVTDPGDFYQGNDRWEVPEDPNSVDRHLQPPYRLFVNKEGGTSTEATDPSDVWSLTSNFVPYGKSNLAAFVSVDSDATDNDNYGKIKVLKMTDGQTPGPGQVANDFSNDPDVRDELLPYQNSGNPPQYGNLLTLPVDGGLIYVEPVYASRIGTTGSYPVLTYVLVSYGGEVGIGSTFTQALDDALGGSGSSTGGGDNSGSGNNGNNGNGNGNNGGQTGTIREQITAKLQAADAAFQAADAAQRNGNSVKWAKEMERGKKLVEQALALSDQLPENSGGSGGSSTPGASETPSTEPSSSESASPSS
ncbi:UPF0182 family membrane protein [Nocardioides mangrovi]|uniref:UPF0182 protein K8U61_21035 n=1 Tax=Nocardioides mangrovi TaxID=2874580 RepID=A0ABS7UIK3_9ACTN|nr:UPF0182 family protein [Nocardioides mangrovi]MBZ5740669.1 UPF0182 family protein [Nocardioides mangrovi]